VYKGESFFRINTSFENVKVKIADIHLDDKALLWNQSFIRSFALGQWPTWERYREAIMGRFRKQPFDDPLSELM